MALRSSVPFELAPEPEDPLPAIVLRYQQLFWAWEAETDAARRAELRAALHACQEALWPLLAEPLVRVAHSWLRSRMARDMWASPSSYPGREDVLRSLAMNMYLHVVDALPQLRIDPEKNLLACLKKIATWGMFDEHQRIYGDAKRQPGGQANAAGEQSVRMWPARTGGIPPTHSDDEAAKLQDPRSVDFEDQLAALLDRQACCQAIWDFWETLTPADQRIVVLRWRRTPALPYETIAQQLGSTWTAATVRQRYHRVIGRTRAHLQKLRLIDDDQLGATEQDR